jgi:hypothetical protein
VTVLPPDLWLSLSVVEAEMVRTQVNVLEQIRSPGDKERFNQARRQLARRLGVPAQEIKAVRLGTASRLARITLHD